MKTVARFIPGDGRPGCIVVDYFCRDEGLSGGTSLNLDDASLVLTLLDALSEMIPAKDYFDLMHGLRKAMTAADAERLALFHEGQSHG
jgi:hypothetical protein